MSAIDFQREEINEKADRRNISYSKTLSKISLSEYAQLNCLELKYDIKMIEAYYNVSYDPKILYNKLVNYCYSRMIKNPRIMIDHKNRMMLLCNYKYNTYSVLLKFKI